jgi:uncharacterized protein
LNEQLLIAANSGDIGRVKQLIGDGAAVNYFNLSGNWSDLDAVELAACNGFADVVHELLLAGASNRTFICSAIKYQHPEVVQEWLSLATSRREINSVDDSMGATPLIQAASGSVEIVRMLVAAGADVNARSWGSDESVLDVAVREGNTEMVNYLWPLCSQETRERAGVPIDPRNHKESPSDM